MGATTATYMTLPVATNPITSHLRKVGDGVNEVIRGLRAQNCEKRNPWLIFILLTIYIRAPSADSVDCIATSGVGTLNTVSVSVPVSTSKSL